MVYASTTDQWDKECFLYSFLDQVPVGTGRRTETFSEVVMKSYDVVMKISRRRNEISRRRNENLTTS